jgi:NAD(P)-dependent dehydrogenase (short-subunit alcohol dehydrogenase family)
LGGSIADRSRRASLYWFDVAVEEDFVRMLDAVEEDLGLLAVMVTNAGVGVAGNVAGQTACQ